ncbi:MAG TPA: DNA repair exonuclease [Candidatus Binataceae bacterium]|nr:DNA repair exonuclease [Candidatus Binataceae bacterium]
MAPSLPPLKLIHTSDVHLESDTFGAGPRGDHFRTRVREAFRGVVQLANERAAHLLLIVGDLFDSSRVEREAFDFAMNTIASARMPVVMIPGNHDAHDERSLYAGVGRERLPANLHLILEPAGQTIEFPELAAHLWGRALVEHSPDFRPLEGLPQPRHDRWNIALAHGFFTDGGETHRSSPITPVEITSSGYHYIALGHIHLFGDVSHGATRAVYCGTPAPLYASSEAGWVAEVTCSSTDGVKVERVVVPNAACAPEAAEPAS